MKNLAEQLIEYSREDYYPFHMPGHKRNLHSVDYEPSIVTDLTEIDGFDNLHYARDILRGAQSRAAELYHTRETYYSVGGSTAALLSAISSCTHIGGSILMARNCHKAVYHTVYLRQLNAVYLKVKQEQRYGISGGINPEDVRAALEKNSEIEVVIITSPTYDGVISDVESISRICHLYGKPLIVDEAHGAHLIFHPEFPKSALECGADLVIHSLHKTLPSMTQTALLHNNSERIAGEVLQRYMSIYQSSSPSYPLMASIDSCICNLLEHGREEFDRYVAELKDFYEDVASCRNIRAVNSDITGGSFIFQWDMSKIILISHRMTGKEMYDKLLDRYHLQMEMETLFYTLGITSIADTAKGYERLAQALHELDEECGSLSDICISTDSYLEIPKKCMNLYEAWEMDREPVDICESAGRISGCFLWLYPPGIPMVVPGEKIDEQLQQYILECMNQNLDVHGLDENRRIGVVR